MAAAEMIAPLTFDAFAQAYREGSISDLLMVMLGESSYAKGWHRDGFAVGARISAEVPIDGPAG